MIRALGSWTYSEADQLGTGGYAKVYACKGESGIAAIKVFRDPTHALAMERELNALTAVAGCPGTPALLDYGRNSEGRLCMVFERAAGMRLDKYLAKHGPLDSARVVAMLRQLLDILAYTHAHGWLHKDTKATNLLIDGDRFTLLDWGLADPIGDGGCLNIRSRVQDAVAPECYYGRHGAATDFYPLGLLAIYALTGVQAYHFDTDADLYYRIVAHCFERPVFPSVLGELLPLVRNWLDKVPERRLVGYDLDALLSEAPSVPPDFSAACDYRQLRMDAGYLLLSARKEVPYAQHALAEKLKASGHVKEARYWFERAASRGYARSSLALARMLAADRDSRVEALLRHAALAGMASAQYRLAEYLTANGGDAGEAARWLRNAAENGDGRAQYQLGRLIETKRGDPAESTSWYGCAADRGHRRAQERLANCYDRGIGMMAVDPAAAAYWRARAANTSEAKL